LSSILRALKKLENDPRHLEENPPLDSQFVPLADTGAQNTAVRLLIPVIGGGLVCGLVILAGWWFFAAKMKPPPVEPQETATQSLPQTEIVPAGPNHPITPESEAAAHIPVSTPVKTPQPTDPAIAPKALMSVDGPEAGPTSQMASVPAPEIKKQVPAEEAAAVARVPAVSMQVKEVEIPVLNDPELKLQAITWSRDPQKRIAVINNRILRQGEAVYGYRIDRINQDDVVLSDAGEQWKLLFRIK
jgi:general secretion pathway protein B